MLINNLNPVAFEIFFIKIHWYSLAYIFGIICGWIYIKKILIKNNIHKIYIDDLITYLIIGIIIGGRLGYVLIYNLKFYLKNPSEIIMIWQGGMSFHGGLIGIIIATVIFCKKNNLEKYIFFDFIAVAAPIGIFFDNIPRHPSQLYEAIFEGIFLFIIMNKIYFSKNYKEGSCSFAFLFFYGIFRLFSEIFREPDQQIGYIFGSLSMGMLLSILMIFIGILLLRRK